MSKMRNLLSLHEPAWSVPLGALGAFATAVAPLCLVQCEFNMADVIKTDDLAANVMMVMFLPMLLPVYWGALMATAAFSALWAGLVMAAWCQYEIGEETEETQQYVAQARWGGKWGQLLIEGLIAVRRTGGGDDYVACSPGVEVPLTDAGIKTTRSFLTVITAQRPMSRMP